MGRSILSIFAGYLTMVVGVSGALAFAAFLVLGEIPTEPKPFEGPVYFLWIELLISVLAAIAGGYVCAFIAGDREMRHVLILAGLLVIFGVLSAGLEAGAKPLWSSLAVPVMGVVGLWIGGRLRLRHRLS